MNMKQLEMLKGFDMSLEQKENLITIIKNIVGNGSSGVPKNPLIFKQKDASIVCISKPLECYNYCKWCYEYGILPAINMESNIILYYGCLAYDKSGDFFNIMYMVENENTVVTVHKDNIIFLTNQ